MPGLGIPLWALPLLFVAVVLSLVAAGYAYGTVLELRDWYLEDKTDD